MGRVFEIEDDGDRVAHSVAISVELVAGTQKVARSFSLGASDPDLIRRTVTYTLPARTDGRTDPWTVRVKRLTAPSDDDQILRRRDVGGVIEVRGAWRGAPCMSTRSHAPPSMP